MKIRPARLSDQAQMSELYRDAFPPDESKLVAQLALDLLKSAHANSLVAENRGQLEGHIAFSPLSIAEHTDYRAVLLAPLAVTPKLQKQGIGGRLVQQGIAEYKASGAHDLYVYGDPNYYARFGFIEAPTSKVEAPYPLRYPFGWQILKLNEHHPTSGKLICVEALQKPELW